MEIRFEDVRNLHEYEKVREAVRRAVIALKARRRVAVGERLSFLFENRETVLFQIQEMIRAERIVADDRIREEMDVYNDLIPEAGELSATMMIEIEEKSRIQPELDRLMGIDAVGCVWLELGDRRAPGRFEAGHSSEEKISAVHFVRFPLPPAARRLVAEGPVALVVEHPRYQARAELGPAVRAELALDLAQPAGSAAEPA